MLQCDPYPRISTSILLYVTCLVPRQLESPTAGFPEMHNSTHSHMYLLVEFHGLPLHPEKSEHYHCSNEADYISRARPFGLRTSAKSDPGRRHDEIRLLATHC